jgi:excisionase family DNA binding protein
MLYTIDEVAKTLMLNPRTIRRYIENGQLRGERVGGSWRVSEEALREMLKSPEIEGEFHKKISQKSESIMELYLQGKHRLQLDGFAVMSVIVFKPQKEPWILEKMNLWMSELNRLGDSARYDFTMTCDEQGLYRLTLIASPHITRIMIGELEKHSK